jgi:hypothetical protein
LPYRFSFPGTGPGRRVIHQPGNKGTTINLISKSLFIIFHILGYFFRFFDLTALYGFPGIIIHPDRSRPNLAGKIAKSGPETEKRPGYHNRAVSVIS